MQSEFFFKNRFIYIFFEGKKEVFFQMVLLIYLNYNINYIKKKVCRNTAASN